jgi:4-hydroxybenzoate polyprenyltransferase
MLLYPWCKRFTNYPQVILGFSLSLGQGIGIGVVGYDIQQEQNSWKLLGIATLYLSAVLNAIIYDTVYAHQDLQDDLQAGVKSMAIACLGWTKQWLSILGSLEVILLAVTGYAVGFQGAYWPVTVGGTALVLVWMLKSWDIEDGADSWYWFCHLIWFTGGTVCVGLAGEYVQRLLAS